MFVLLSRHNMEEIGDSLTMLPHKFIVHGLTFQVQVTVTPLANGFTEKGFKLKFKWLFPV